ncbi:MAG: hypothetical protein ABFS30_11735 [Pseudomonadota bacterium]
MLSTTWAGILASFALALAFSVTIYVIFLARYCYNAVRFIQTQNKRAVSLARLAEVEATLTELSDAYDALLSRHRKLRARIGMRKVRENAQEPAIPDPAKDPDGWKRAMRLKLKSEGVLK